MKNVEISIEKLEKSPYNIRVNDPPPKYLQELAESIKATKGPIEKPHVHLSEDGKFYVFEGWDRVLACKLLGIQRIRCIVHENLTPQEILKLSYILNTKRRRITEIERAIAIKKLYNEYIKKMKDWSPGDQSYEKNMNFLYGKDVSIRKFSEWLGESYTTVRRYLIISDLEEEVKRAIMEGIIDTHTAEELSKLPSNIRLDFINTIYSIRDRKISRETLMSIIDHLKRGYNLDDALRISRYAKIREMLKLYNEDVQNTILRVLLRKNADENDISVFLKKLNLIRQFSIDLHDEVIHNDHFIGRIYDLNIEYLSFIINKLNDNFLSKFFKDFNVNINYLKVKVFKEVLLISSYDSIPGSIDDLDSKIARVLATLKIEIAEKSREVNEIREKVEKDINEIDRYYREIEVSVDLDSIKEILENCKVLIKRLDDEWPQSRSIILGYFDGVLQSNEEVSNDVEAYFRVGIAYAPLRRYFNNKFIINIPNNKMSKDEIRECLVGLTKLFSEILSIMDKDVCYGVINILHEFYDKVQEYRSSIQKLIKYEVSQEAESLDNLKAIAEKINKLKEIIKAFHKFFYDEYKGEKVQLFFELLEYIYILKQDEYANAHRIYNVRNIIKGIIEKAKRAVELMNYHDLAETIKSMYLDDDVDRPWYIHEFISCKRELEVEYQNYILRDDIKFRYNKALAYGDLHLLKDILKEVIEEEWSKDNNRGCEEINDINNVNVLSSNHPGIDKRVLIEVRIPILNKEVNVNDIKRISTMTWKNVSVIIAYNGVTKTLRADITLSVRGEQSNKVSEMSSITDKGWEETQRKISDQLREIDFKLRKRISESIRKGFYTY